MKLKKIFKPACLFLTVMLIINFQSKGLTKSSNLFFYGNIKNDLYLLLKREGYILKRFSTPGAAVKAASRGSGVLIVADNYPQIDPANRITAKILSEAMQKGLKLYVEYPTSFPGLNIPSEALETNLERGVITKDVFAAPLKNMSLVGIHNCHVLPVQAKDPLIVLAKVVGFDKAEYGLENTKAYPLLFKHNNNIMISMTGLSNFERGRYGPTDAIQSVLKFIISHLTSHSDVTIKYWHQDVKPMFERREILSAGARLNSVKKGADWFYKGRFFPDKSWSSDVSKYGSDGTKPTGPPISQSRINGDGKLGVLEGHISTISYKGDQGYRYWMRADVQGEVAMTLAAAGKLFNNQDYKDKSANLMEYVFKNSNLRQGPKNDPASAAYGLIGWATTNAGTFYGDDNSRAILGMIAASSYLKTDKWDKELTEAIMGNFRTTGIKGFRVDRLEEADIIKNGWPYYWNRDVVNISPHFESWMWACYLWLYNKTAYAPLLERTKKAIKITMDAYPEKWLWGSSMQTQRARMILPLAWLVRIENTEEHRQWLDKMINEILKYQDESGAISEELGKGKGMFKALNKNEDYGTDEGSLIFRNGEKVSCMLYTCNFALFSLNEAAAATGNTKYKAATEKLSDFLTRIQVQSKVHPDLDGAWLRGFDYGRWDYWASNSDAGWGAWCTLTGWIQSWIVTTQAQIEQKESFWEVTATSKINDVAKPIIQKMMKEADK